MGLLALWSSLVLGAAPEPLTAQTLGELVYRLEGLPHQVQLRQGRWQGPAPAPGAVSAATAQLVTDLIGRGDVDGDGVADAVVLLHHGTGGTGQFLHLAVVSPRGGGPRMVASRRVGDRMQVRDLRVRGRDIVIDVVRAGSGDPACCPGELASVRWALREGRLVALPDLDAARRLSPAVLEGTRWALSQWSPGEQARSSPPIELAFAAGQLFGHAGCNRFKADVSAGEWPGALKVTPPVATRMACEEPLMQAEQRFLDRLAQTTSFGFHDGRLVVNWSRGPEGGALFFSRQ